MHLEKDELQPIEFNGEYMTIQKKGASTIPCLALHYAPIPLYTTLYMPETSVMSVETLGLASLGITSDDLNAPRCPDCQTAICKRAEIVEYPAYLRFNIYRTYFDEKTFQSQKDCSVVSLNPTIQIGQEVYALYSIVVHAGASFDSGHYIVYCRHADDGNNTLIDNPANKWYLLNDDSVYPRNWSEVLLELADYGFCPYYVVYARITSLHHTTQPILPGYYHQSPSNSEYCKALVEEMETRNDHILGEIPVAPFLLDKLNQGKRKELSDIPTPMK